MATGQEVACLELEELLRAAGDTATGHVRALKLHLQRLCGHPRFRQRLLQEDGQILPDEAVLQAPRRLNLVILSFAETSVDHIDRLFHAVRSDDTEQLEAILRRPQDPNHRRARDNMTALHVAAMSGLEEGHKVASGSWCRNRLNRRPGRHASFLRSSEWPRESGTLAFGVGCRQGPGHSRWRHTAWHRSSEQPLGSGTFVA